MPGRQAPSEGTKVTMGNQAPVTHEGSGAVRSDSLAAESQAFQASNRISEGASAMPQEGYSKNTSSSVSEGDTGVKSGCAASAGTAPGYAQHALHSQDPSGPHGKNLKEDKNLEGQNASSEFGTANDPGRLAEKKFALGANTAPVATGGREEHVNKKAPYDALSSEKEA
ncbi:hypothetical protein PG999_012974 [Apiospora kogelbergensis]|uniref:Uncharacterized protein n=1 Tax=Apiospora kogelbergensis TaxID=1337665 RepID=A0AAW0Q8E9_9PEZI